MSARPNRAAPATGNNNGAGLSRGLMSRSRSSPLHEFMASSTAQANATYALEPYFSETVPDVLEFGSAWSEVSDHKANIESSTIFTSSLRRSNGGGAASLASSLSGSRAAVAASASLMGPAGGSAVSLGMTRRFVNITFFTQLNQVQIITDDAKVPLTIRVFNRRGEPLQPWDFYVGAVIDVLGRPTTLTSASAATQLWLDGAARRLWKSKIYLEERLNKFRAKPHADLETGPFKKLLLPGTSLGGTVPLNQLATCIAKLEEELRMFQ